MKLLPAVIGVTALALACSAATAKEPVAELEVVLENAAPPLSSPPPLSTPEDVDEIPASGLAEIDVQSHRARSGGYRDDGEDYLGDLLFGFEAGAYEPFRPAVAELLQRALLALGFYSGPINGDFDANTTTALTAYQRAVGLETSNDTQFSEVYRRLLGVSEI